MNESDLKAILARNPAISISETCSSVPPSEPEPGKADALDPVVQRQEESKTRPIVRFRFFRQRLVDADAVHGGAKDLLDGLQEAGLIPGDREDQIDFDARQEKVHYKKDERTEIEITLP